jgi:UDP-MurNAc hydroxylase
MKFTILSHAGLLTEHNGKQIICDPWIIGSCYWRSWWNFPEPSSFILENLKPDYIYLTHLHWDHFHGASLQKFFDTDIHILIPEVPTRRMIQDLNYLGFHNITEIKHGSSFELGKDFNLYSYQFGLGVDSAIILEGGGYTIFNCNDCKFFGLPLKQITNRFPVIDFALRSHSNASPIPYCIEGYKTYFPNFRQHQDYIEEFTRFALSIGARFAIPFASNHCFLHKETFHFNKTSVSPKEILSTYKELAKKINSKSECIIMAPGSSWDEDGFKIAQFDYSNKDKYYEYLHKIHSEKLEHQYAKEKQAVADFESFEHYFIKFIKSIPWPVKKWLKLNFIFQTSDLNGSHHWMVNISGSKINSINEPCDESIVLEIPPLILNDCCMYQMFSVWGASKRLKIHLPSPDHLYLLEIFFLLLDFYELDMLPIRKNFTYRSVNIRFRRWREGVEAFKLLIKHRLLRRQFRVVELYSLPENIKIKSEKM